jgi:site-specific recombinase XerD
MVSASRLLELGLGLMGDAKALVTKRAIERHQQHRDGLVIALLACRPLRRANLAGIRIGRQLQRIGTTWVLLFQPHKTKARQPIEVFLPEFLTPYIDHYIKYVRPAFPRSDSHDGLWASSKGCPMSDGALYDAVMRRTRTAFGHGINPHLFRDIAATTVATLAPEQVLIAKDLLGHARFETTERFYNQAYSLDASRSYQHVVAELREAARREHPGRWHRIALHATVEETP